MATALILFTQGGNTDVAGKAVLGDAGAPVTVTNGNNTGVSSWKIYLLDAPSDSGTFPAASQPQILAQAANAAPTVVFTPDVAGSYRVMLEVTDGGGAVDRDIRCFGVPDSFGFAAPPYQQNPEPLPVALPGIITLDPRPVKPDEQNYGSNVRGWAGSGSTAQLDEFFRRHVDLPFRTVDVTPYTPPDLRVPLYIVDLEEIGGSAEFNLPLSPRVGFVVRIAVFSVASDVVTVQAQGGGNVGSGRSGATVDLGPDEGAIFVHQGGNDWIIHVRSGSSGSAAPLSNTLYVDLNTSAATPDGSISAPFDTLTGAIAAAASGDTLLVTPGDYSAEGALTIGKNLTIAPTTPVPVGIAGLSSFYSGVITVDDVAVAAGFGLFLFGTNVGTLDLEDSTAGATLDYCVVSAVTGDGAINAWASILPLPLPVHFLVVYNCQLVGSPETITLTGDTCDLVHSYLATSGATAISFTGFSGTVRVDDYTNYWIGLLQTGPGFSITNGFKLVIGASLPNAQLVNAWDATSPEVLTVLTVPHPAGVYLLTGSAVVINAADTGTLARTVSWSTQTFGADSHVLGSVGATTTGSKFQDSVVIVSDGSAAVTVTFAGSSITGAASVHLYATAVLQGSAS